MHVSGAPLRVFDTCRALMRRVAGSSEFELIVDALKLTTEFQRRQLRWRAILTAAGLFLVGLADQRPARSRSPAAMAPDRSRALAVPFQACCARDCSRIYRRARCDA